jgi:hypothetical protein
VGGEPGDHAVQEPRAGGVAFVGQRLDVGEAGVVVDGDVQVVVAVPAASGLFAGPVQAPAAAVGHPPEFLHVHVQQVAGGGVFVTAIRAAPDGFAGDRVDRGQRRHAVAAQHPADGGGGQAEFASQEHRAAAQLRAGLQDRGLDLRWDAGRGAVRARGAVFQAGPAFFLVAVQPLVHRGPGDAQLLGHTAG